MKISLNWLNEYIDIQDQIAKPQELANLLTAGGIEVEGVENLAKVYDHVVIGHILKKEQHPNADRLSVCQISTGDGVVHQIVCGAKNHSAGDNVVAALPGAILPGNFAIKKSKIRDVESGGMLCSNKELGLPGESEGIVILPKDAPAGQAFAKYMSFDDILFELKVTPNRADCLSHFGLAREIAAVLGRPTKFPVDSLIEDGGSTCAKVALELKAADLAPRYAGRGVMGVKVAPSPAWLVKRLESVGMKPINNVVDVTNYVMMELGQPLHAFDFRQIQGGKIIVDRAVKGEKFTTLDGSELTLDGTELTIRDANRPVALAGIVGGKNSGIQDDTTNIFIEAAYFVPSAIRRTARKFGIETDSSYRFARGTNPEAVPLAMNRAALLIQKIAGGKIMGEHHDQYPSPIRHSAIEIDLALLSDRLGYKVDGAEFLDWMQRLDCKVMQLGESERGPRWSVTPPLFRWDMALDMDLVEEFARLHGYQHIPETLPALASAPALHDASFTIEAKIRRLLQGEGASQAINYAFVSSVSQERILGVSENNRHALKGLGLRVTEEPIAIVNPLNEELNVMRTSLLPGLVKNILNNSRFGNSSGRLYELGYAHFAGRSEHASAGRGEAAVNSKASSLKAGGELAMSGDSAYTQEHRLAFAFWGHRADLWHKKPASDVVFELKGAVEGLFKGLQMNRWKWFPLQGETQVPEFLHPGQCARLEYEGKPAGFIGTLHPLIAEEFKIRESVAVAEFNLERLLTGQPKSPSYKSISRMPSMERDIALQMPKDLPASNVETEIKKAAGDLLTSVTVFDIFEGGNLPEGQRSVAFRMVFQAKDATLEDAAINGLRDKVVEAVTKKFGLVLR